MIKKGTVKATVTDRLRIRDVTDPTKIIGYLYYNSLLRKGDSVYGDLRADNRIYFNKVYRASGTIDNITGSSAVRDATAEYMTLSDEAEPIPAPVPPYPVGKPIRIVVGGEDYKILSMVENADGSATIELEQK